MDVKIDILLSQIRALEQYADMLLEIRFSLARHKNSLNKVWVASETEEINDVINRLNRQASRLADELYEIEHDMIKAFEEWAQEE